MKLLSTLFLLAGLTLFAIGSYQIFLRENPNRLAFDNYSAKQKVVSEQGQLPRRIIIKDLRIDTPIIPATVTNNKWQVTENGASYLSSSPLPGTEGNSVIYAHNWKNLFGSLLKAKIGQEVQVVFPDDTVRTFVVSYASEVSPNESTILAPSTDKRITLYTCSGFLDSKRFVVVAILKGNAS